MRFIGAPIILTSLAVSFLFAQPSSSPSLPTEPRAIIQALKDRNGFSSLPAVPWHLKLTWDQFDQDGDNIHSGSIEEFFSGPKRYKIVFAGDDYNQTEIANDSGLFLADPGKWPFIPELRALEFVQQPLHRFDDEPKDLRLEVSNQTFGSLTLTCIKALRTGVIEIGPPSYCFDPVTSQLRFSRAPGIDGIAYNKMRNFQGRNIGQEITASIGGKPTLRVHVEGVDELPSLSEGMFTPPAGELPLSGRIKVASSILTIEKRGQLEAIRGQQGKVKVDFVVGKDGKVVDAQAESGPPDIQKAALRAMRQYRFRPFLILDQPIEVEGTMEFSVN